MVSGTIDITIRLYLEQDVNYNEAQQIVESLECEIKHPLISDIDLYHFELPNKEE